MNFQITQKMYSVIKVIFSNIFFKLMEVLLTILGESKWHIWIELLSKLLIRIKQHAKHLVVFFFTFSCNVNRMNKEYI